jgi:hypothetical protein
MAWWPVWQSNEEKAAMARASFTDHPHEVGETYTQHLANAWGFGGRMLLGGCACIVHGLLPFLFTATASRTIGVMHDRMVLNRRRLETAGHGAARAGRSGATSGAQPHCVSSGRSSI